MSAAITAPVVILLLAPHITVTCFCLSLMSLCRCTCPLS